MARKANNLEPVLTIKKIYQKPKDVLPEHQEFLKKIGLKLQELRNNKDVSISSLSTQLEISRNAYGQMESGKVYFNFFSLMQILDFHKLNAEEFFRELKYL